MKKLIISFILSVLMVLTTSYAAANFSVNTNSLSDTLEITQSSSETFSVENNGSIVKNFSLSTSSENGISTLSVNETSITLTPGESKTLSLEYSASNTRGTFTGEVLILDDNSNENETIDFSLDVLGPELMFVDESDDRLEMSGRTDDQASQTFTLRNTGDFNLFDITFNIEDLRGDDDDIRDNDIFFNGDDEGDFEINQLNAGEEIEIEIEIDVPSGIESEDYAGDFDLVADYNGAGSPYSKEFRLEIEVTSDEEDVFFDNFEPIRIFAEAGETADFDLIIENDGNNDVDNLELEVDDDFEERNTANTLPTSAFSFESSSFDVRDRDDEEVNLEIEIPDDQPQGTYIGEINLLNSVGDELDSIRVEVRVIGDVYIQNIDFPEEVSPGDLVDVEIELRNQGSKIYRNVKLNGFLFNVNREGADLEKSSSNFLMSSGDTVTKTLRFRMPDDATDGLKTLEVRLTYDDAITSEVESIDVVRPLYNLKITSNNINPRVVKCEDTIYTFLEVENLGRSDERIRISSQIQGTDIRIESNILDLDTDDRIQETLTLPVSNLEPGTYTVVQSVEGQRTVSEDMLLRVDECNGTGGIDLNPTNQTNTTGNQTQTGDNTVSFFGNEINRTSAILGTTLAGIALLIVVSLFFL